MTRNVPGHANINALHTVHTHCSVVAVDSTFHVEQARLINFVLAGKREPIRRSDFGQSAPRLMARLTILDTAMIGMGNAHLERKVALAGYSVDGYAAEFARIQGDAQ